MVKLILLDNIKLPYIFTSLHEECDFGLLPNKEIEPHSEFLDFQGILIVNPFMLKVLLEICRWSCDIFKNNSESNSFFTRINISGISEVGSVKIYKSNSLGGRKYRQKYC